MRPLPLEGAREGVSELLRKCPNDPHPDPPLKGREAIEPLPAEPKIQYLPCSLPQNGSTGLVPANSVRPISASTTAACSASLEP